MIIIVEVAGEFIGFINLIEKALCAVLPKTIIVPLLIESKVSSSSAVVALAAFPFDDSLPGHYFIVGSRLLVVSIRPVRVNSYSMPARLEVR